MQTVDAILDDLTRREGDTFSDRPADKGGPTKYGITLTTLQAYWPDVPGVEALKALTEAQARTIYAQRYVYAPQFNLVRNNGLRALLVDMGVQHGQVTVIRMLQKQLDLAVDGILGPISLQVINSTQPAVVYFSLLAARCELYGELIAHDRALAYLRANQFGMNTDAQISQLQALNALGWARRVAEFIRLGADFSI